MSAPARTLPAADGVARILTSLLGRAVTARKVAVAPAKVGLVGVYALAREPAAAVIAFDVGLAAHVGAALALVPPAVAAECARKGKLEDNLRENTAEVLNILCPLVNPAGAPHLGLREVVTAVADEIKPMVSSPARLELDVQVSGYGGGRLTVAVR